MGTEDVVSPTHVQRTPHLTSTRTMSGHKYWEFFLQMRKLRLPEAPGVINCNARSQSLLQPLFPTVTQGVALVTMAQEGAKRKVQSRSTQQAKCVLTDSPSPPQCYEGMRAGHTGAPGRQDRREGHTRRGPQAMPWHYPDATVRQGAGTGSLDFRVLTPWPWVDCASLSLRVLV